MHCDYGQELTLGELLDRLPGKFKTVNMETSTLHSNDYASIVATMESWFLNERPKFTEMTVFVDAAPTAAELTAFLNTFPFTEVTGTLYLICNTPATNEMVAAMEMDYIGAAVFNRLPGEQKYHLFAKKEKDFGSLVLGYKCF
uniref:Uncharacterized protein n=1 Tax=Panagrolaimus davidi TaxID=227884 RepID=A0A914PQJ9_9BILA